tara:strand:- start:4613 stop:6952 length:2340 start_codon:yes stop_codon:yes gene_type:complete
MSCTSQEEANLGLDGLCFSATCSDKTSLDDLNNCCGPAYNDSTTSGISQDCWDDYWEDMFEGFAVGFCSTLNEWFDETTYNPSEFCEDSGTYNYQKSLDELIVTNNALPAATQDFLNWDIMQGQECPGCEEEFGFEPWNFFEEAPICCEVGSQDFWCHEGDINGMWCGSNPNAADPTPIWGLPDTDEECRDWFGDSSLVYDANYIGRTEAIEDTGCICPAGAGKSWDGEQCVGEDMSGVSDPDDDEAADSDDMGMEFGEGGEGGEGIDETPEESGGDSEAEEEAEEVTCDTSYGECCLDTDCPDEYYCNSPNCPTSCGNCVMTLVEPDYTTFDECIMYKTSTGDMISAATAVGSSELGANSLQDCFEEYPSTCENSYCNGTTDFHDVDSTGYSNTGCCDCFDAFLCAEGVGACVGEPIDICQGGGVSTFMSCLSTMGICSYTGADPLGCAETYLGTDDGRWGYNLSDAVALLEEYIDAFNDEREGSPYAPVYLEDCAECVATNATASSTIETDPDGNSVVVHLCECDAGYHVRGDDYDPVYDANACLMDFVYEGGEEEFEFGDDSTISSRYYARYPVNSSHDAVFSTLPSYWYFTAAENVASATPDGSIGLAYYKYSTLAGDAWGDVTTADVRLFFPQDMDGGSYWDKTSMRVEAYSDAGETEDFDGFAEISYRSTVGASSYDGVSPDEAAALGEKWGQVGDETTDISTLGSQIESEITALAADVAAQMGLTTTDKILTFKKIARTNLNENMLSIFDTKDVESATTQTISVTTAMTTYS